jgi:predicted dinucleotide-binding enzyme
MRIAVIGAGSVGAALGQAWLARGEDVVWGVRNPSDPKYALPRERMRRPAAAAGDAEVVVIATPWPATEAAVKGLGPLTNPLVLGRDGVRLALGFDTSVGERVAGWAPGAFVFKALNTTGANNMVKATQYVVRPMMPVAGDDGQKKWVVSWASHPSTLAHSRTRGCWPWFGSTRR